MVDRGQVIGAVLFLLLIAVALLLVVAWRDPGGERSALGAHLASAGAR